MIGVKNKMGEKDAKEKREFEEIEEEGIMVKRLRVKGETWKIIGVYKWGYGKKINRLKGWMETKEEAVKVIIGRDFNARTGEKGGKDCGEEDQ